MAEAKRQLVIALVGGETLLGREVRDLIAAGKFPARLKLIGAAEEMAGSLTEIDGEPVVVSSLDEENLTGAAMVVLAGSPASSRRTLKLLRGRSSQSAIIDLSGGLEELPEARLRAPVAGPADENASRDAIHVIAHPAAVAVALPLMRLAPRRSVAQIFEPASERGQGGVDELQRQVVSLLSFKPLPKAVFDVQVAFNLLARYGEDAPVKLEEVESRIDRHLATLLSRVPGVPMPSLRLIQAPVFHGYGISLWMEFDDPADASALSARLASAEIDVRTSDLDPPDNVGIAGQSGISVGAIAGDRNNPRAVWAWVMADNLRLSADNAVTVARQLLGEEW